MSPTVSPILSRITPHVRRVTPVLAMLAGTCVTFAVAACGGLAILILLFKAGVAGGVDILFYRGVVLCGVAFVLTIALLAYLGHATGRASLRDAVAAGFLSLGLNLSVLVIAPVTFDRSLSVFILGYMAAHHDETFRTGEIEAAMRDIYVGELRQIERRMQEQLRSGNVIQSNGTYTISPQGLAFVTWARRIGWLFDVDPRLLARAPQATESKSVVGAAQPKQ
jgi:hypothetical protein